MNLSKSTTKELERVLADKKLARQTIDGEIAALEQVLAQQRSAAGPKALPKPVQMTRQQSAPLKGHALRSALLTVVGQRGGLVPLEVTKAMKSAGFELDGKTSLHTRVYNELWRLSNNEPKVLRKDEKGGFWLAEEAATG